jgi:hypothetical protein
VNCPTCNAELVQRDRATLFLAAAAFAAVAVALCWLSRWLWPVEALLTLISAYLAIWAGWARGVWCRTCKRFPAGRL